MRTSFGVIYRERMIVGVCTIQLAIPMSDSLKAKRHALKPLIAYLRNHFNVSVAEVDDNDVWRRATIGVACISNDHKYAHGLLMQVVDAVERRHYDATLVDYQIEMY